MGYFNARISRLKARLKRVQDALNALYDNYSELSTSTTDGYKFDSGEGSQSVTRKKLTEIQKNIEVLEAEEEHYINELSGMGLINIGMRRIKPNR